MKRARRILRKKDEEVEEEEEEKALKNESLPLEKTGVWPVSCSSTLAALVSLSPDSPTQMLTHSLVMPSWRITFLLLSLGSFFSFFFFSTLPAATLAGAAAAGVSFFDLGA